MWNKTRNYLYLYTNSNMRVMWARVYVFTNICINTNIRESVVKRNSNNIGIVDFFVFE